MFHNSKILALFLLWTTYKSIDKLPYFIVRILVWRLTILANIHTYVRRQLVSSSIVEPSIMPLDFVIIALSNQ